MNRKWINRIITLAVLIGLGVAAYFWWQNFQAQAAAQALADLQTVEINRGPLIASIGATGTVRANQSATLTWQTSGTVDNVGIAVGDLVSASQILASLRDSSLSQSIILAEADLINARKSLETLQEPVTELTLAQAQQAITNAEKAVEDAQSRLTSLNSSASQTNIDSARATVVLALDKFEKAQDAYAPYENRPENDVLRATFLNALSAARAEYDAAVRRLNGLLATADATELAIAENNLLVAQASLTDAQKRYQELLEGPDADDIRAAEVRITAIEATLELKHVKAPFDGTITRVDAKPGDQVTPGAIAFRLDDLSRMVVEVNISEVDINRVTVGQAARLTFDGVLGKEYTGEVVEVAKVGSVTAGIVEFSVKIELLDADEDVRPGMTAAVNIVVSELEDALLVPNRAVRVRDGQRVVYILENNTPTPVTLDLGLSSETQSEALNTELQVGDLVILNPPQVFDVDGPPPFVNR